jgi:hypothetical protein
LFPFIKSITFKLNKNFKKKKKKKKTNKQKK